MQKTEGEMLVLDCVYAAMLLVADDRHKNEDGLWGGVSLENIYLKSVDLDQLQCIAESLEELGLYKQVTPERGLVKFVPIREKK